MTYLLAAVGILLGWLFLERGKRKSAEALNDNLETKEKVDANAAKQAQNNASLTLEEERRKDIEKKVQDEKANNTVDDILDFLNKPKQ